MIKKYTDIEELTTSMINEFIEKVISMKQQEEEKGNKESKKFMFILTL